MSKNKEIKTQLPNTVNITELREALKIARVLGRPVVILGPQGNGKTSIPAQHAAAEGMEDVQVRAALSQPEDVAGHPAPAKVTIDGQEMRISDNLMPVIAAKCWLKYSENHKPVMLFFDEINQAPPNVMACLFEAFGAERAINGTPLPPGTQIVAAGNLASDRGITNDIPFPLINRSILLEFTGPTKEEFEDYMRKKGFHPEVQALLITEPNWISQEFDEDAVDGRNPTPRSWELVSDLMHYADNNKISDRIRLKLAAGSIGSSAAIKLETMLKLRHRIPSIAQIMADPDSVAVDAADLVAHYICAIKLVQAVESQETFDKGMQFMRRIRKEVIGVFLKSILIDDNKSKYVLARLASLNEFKTLIREGSSLAKSAR